VPVTRRAQEGCQSDSLQHGPRHANGIFTGLPALRGQRAPSLAEQQTIEDALRGLTRILYAAVERQHLILILVRVINTSISTLAPSNRLPPGYPCAIYPVLAATRFDTADPMPLVFFYNCHDSLIALVCAEVCQANFSPPRSRLRRTCSRSLSWSSAAGTESAAHISTICRKSGDAPAVMRVGRRTLISAEAAAQWRRRMEDAAREAPARIPKVKLGAHEPH
jgi:hypothetical protein